VDVCCESLEAAGASMRPSGSSPAARPPLRHRRRPAHAGEGPSLARPTPSLASPPLAGEAHALASEGPSPARVKALAGEAPRQRGPSPRWRGCPRQRGPRPRQRERVRFLMRVKSLSVSGQSMNAARVHPVPCSRPSRLPGRGADPEPELIETGMTWTEFRVRVK
jgi:hypothetical protein